MKMKKLLAGVLAGAITLSAVTFTSLTLSAADDPNEKILYQRGSMSTFIVEKDKLQNVSNSITITIDGTVKNAEFGAQAINIWDGGTSGTSPLVISKDSFAENGETKFGQFKENGIQLYNLSNFSIINTITLSIDGATPTTLYELENDEGTSYDENGYPNGQWALPLKITPAILDELNVKTVSDLNHLKFNTQITKIDGSGSGECAIKVVPAAKEGGKARNFCKFLF